VIESTSYGQLWPDRSVSEQRCTLLRAQIGFFVVSVAELAVPREGLFGSWAHFDAFATCAALLVASSAVRPRARSISSSAAPALPCVCLLRDTANFHVYGASVCACLTPLGRPLFVSGCLLDSGGCIAGHSRGWPVTCVGACR